MKKETEKIDELIKETLSRDEAGFYDELHEQGVLEMIEGLFKGKLKWLVLLMNIVQLAFFAGFIYCLVAFLNTDITDELIRWAAGGFLCLMVVALLKLFLWMQMDKNALLRELKRVELQVSVLSGKVSVK